MAAQQSQNPGPETPTPASSTPELDGLPPELRGRFLEQIEADQGEVLKQATLTEDSWRGYLARLFNLSPNQTTFYEQLSLQAPALMMFVQRMFGI